MQTQIDRKTLLAQAKQDLAEYQQAIAAHKLIIERLKAIAAL